MKAQRETASFLLRFTHDLWHDPQGDPRIEWRGHVCRVQDGAELRFKDLAEALIFIKESLLQLTQACVPAENQAYQEKARQESFKLWERFAQSHPPMMIEAIQQTGKHPEAIEKQGEEATEQAIKASWFVPSSALPTASDEVVDGVEQAQLHQKMLALQAQVEALSSKIAQLEAANMTQQ